MRLLCVSDQHKQYSIGAVQDGVGQEVVATLLFRKHIYSSACKGLARCENRELDFNDMSGQNIFPIILILRKILQVPLETVYLDT